MPEYRENGPPTEGETEAETGGETDAKTQALFDIRASLQMTLAP